MENEMKPFEGERPKGPVTSMMDDTAPDTAEAGIVNPAPTTLFAETEEAALSPADDAPADGDRSGAARRERGWFLWRGDGYPSFRHGFWAVMLVLLADYFIYNGSGGAGYAVFIAASALILVFANRPHFWGRMIPVWLLLLALCAHAVWQCDDGVPWVAAALLFAVSWRTFGLPLIVPDLLLSAMLTIRSMVPQANQMLLNLCRPAGRWVRDRRNWAPVLVPLIICLIFAVVFGLANAVLAEWLTPIGRKILDIIRNLPAYFPSGWRIVFWLGMWLLSSVYLLPKICPTRFSNAAAELPVDEAADTKQASAPDDARREVEFVPVGDAPSMATEADAKERWGQTWRNTLLAVNLLFLAYLALEVRYLFTGCTLPEGVSYSDYAHKGVFWLTLALALTSLVLGIIFSGKAQASRFGGQLRSLGYVWIVLNGVLGLLAFERLYIYFGFNGLTQMRIVGAYGILLVLIGLALVARMIVRRHCLRWLIRQQLAALALALLALYLTPSGWLSVRVNVALIEAAKTHDDLAPAVILARHPLAAEGVPPLMPLLAYENPRLSAEDCQSIRDGAKGLLLKLRHDLQRERDTGWKGYDRSRSVAMRFLSPLVEGGGLRSPATLMDHFRTFTNPWY